MKQLNYYNKLGKSSEEEIFNYFLTTLKDSIYTWDYFTDFKKSMSNANKYKKLTKNLQIELINQGIIDNITLSSKELKW